jgi:hypothetical protein
MREPSIQRERSSRVNSLCTVCAVAATARVSKNICPEPTVTLTRGKNTIMNDINADGNRH